MKRTEGTFCPLVNTDCLKARCTFWVRHDRTYDCAFRVLPMLMQQERPQPAEPPKPELVAVASVDEPESLWRRWLG